MELFQIQSFIAFLLDEQKRLAETMCGDNNKTGLIKELECINKLLALLCKYRDTYKSDKPKKKK